MSEPTVTVSEVTAPGLPPRLWRPLLEAVPAPGLMPVLPGDPVVIVAPHPDDESLGAGGLLHRLTTAGADVTLVVVTDGAAGYPSATAEQRRELSTTRRRETGDALWSLGLGQARKIFFDLPDGDVDGHEPELRTRMSELLADALPVGSLCIGPWPHDPHPDHQAVGRAVADAAESVGAQLWQYPIWMRHSMHPDDPRADIRQLHAVCLTAAERQAKRVAIESHASQLTSPFAGYGPVLPDHVLELFADGLEPFFITAAGRSSR